MREKKIAKLKRGERAAGISTLAILLLGLAEALVGFFSKSGILLTDALHNVGDSLASFASWLGLKISQRKSSERFPYGYYKAENLAAFFVSLLILYASFELIIEGYSRLFVLPEISMPLEALSISAFSIVFSLLLAKYLKKVGKEINSQSLLTNAKERFTHIFSSSVVFIVILLSSFKVPYVEGFTMILFSLFILKAGILSAKDSIFSLMDVAPSKELSERVKKIILSVNGVESLEMLKLRKSGPFVFGEAVIRVGKTFGVKRAHEIADKVERKVREEVEEIDSLTLHLEPYEREEVKVAIPITLDKGLNSRLSNHFGRADNFIFLYLNRKNKKIKDFYVKPNPHKQDIVKAGLSVSKFLLKERVDVVITKEMGEISFHTLRDNLIEIYKAQGDRVGDVVRNFLEERLEPLEKPTRKEEEKVSTKFQRGWGGWRGRWRGRGRGGGPWWRRL